MTGDVAPSPAERRGARILHATFALVVLYVLVVNLDTTPYDDSYFFKRIALHFLEYGKLSWNVEDGPVYGVTSQLFQVVVVALTRVAPLHVVVASKVVLAVLLVLTASLLMGRCGSLTLRFTDGAVVGLAALSSPLVLAAIHTGMETALALLLVTLSLGQVGPGRSPRAPRPVVAALLTTLVYTCRPDAALIPAIAFVLDRRRDARAVGVFAGTLLLALGASFVAFNGYYGSPLPLPFYAKTRGLGSQTEIIGLVALSTPLHATTLLAFLGPLLPTAVARRNRRGDPFAIAAILFVLYHLVFTHEVMGYKARFYVPAVVPLALAAAAGWDGFVARVRSSRVAWLLLSWLLFVALLYALELVAVLSSPRLERMPWQVYLVPALMIGALASAGARGPRPATRLAVAALPWVSAFSVAPPPPRPGIRLRTDDAYVVRSSTEVTTVRGIWDVARCLPNLRQLYHSEIGVPGLVFPKARIVDLAGMMSNELAFRHPEFDEYCARDRPEVIFLPQLNYRELNRKIGASFCLGLYTRVTGRSSSPLYVRDDLAPAFLECARDVYRWQ